VGDTKGWEIRDAKDVAEALDWLRRRMKGKGLLLLAVGVNSIAFAKEVGVSPEDCEQLLHLNLPAILQGLIAMQNQRVTRSYIRRGDVDYHGEG